MSPFFDTIIVAEINSTPRYRMVEVDRPEAIDGGDAPSEADNGTFPILRDLCAHEHASPEEARDCDDARIARGLDPLPKPLQPPVEMPGRSQADPQQGGAA